MTTTEPTTGSRSSTALGTITPAALTISATSQTKVYDGTAASTAAPTDSGLFTTGGDTITGLSQAFASKNVLGTNGSTLQVTGYAVNDGDGGKDYTVTLHTASGTITPAALSITASGQTKVYDGTTASTAAPSYSGLITVGGDTITGLTQAFASKNVLGTNGSTLQVTGYTVNDGDGGNDYTVSLHTAGGTITPAALSISATGQTKVYDGTTASTAAPTDSGLITVGGDTITGLSQAFASKNVLGTNGSTLQVTGYTVNDGDGGNDYTVSLNTAGGTITPAALSITATGQTKVYDGTTASTAAPTDSGLITVGGDTITGLNQAFASKNVLGTNGSTLQVTGYTINDGDGGNDYTVTLHTASGTITPAAPAISATSQTKVYDGTTASTAIPTYSGLMTAGGDTVTGLTQAFASKNVLGTNGSTLQVTGYTVNDGDGGNDYTVTLHTALGTITPAALHLRDRPDQGLRRHDDLDGRPDLFRTDCRGRRHGHGPEPGVCVQERAGHQWQHAPGHRLHGRRRRWRQGLHGHTAHRRRHHHSGGAEHLRHEPDQGVRRHHNLDGRPDLLRADHGGWRHDHGPDAGFRVEECAGDQWQHAAGRRLHDQ